MESKEPILQAAAPAETSYLEAYPPTGVSLIPPKNNSPVEIVSLSKLYFGDNSVARQVEPEPSPGLIASIKKHGFLGALIGCRRGWRVQLVNGRRRFLAAKAAGLAAIPVHLISLDNESLYWLALEEFFFQANLTPLDEAYAFAQARHRVADLEKLANHIGRELEWVQNRLALLKYPDIEKALRDNLIDADAAYELAQIEDGVVRKRFLNQWQATHTRPSRMLIVPLELPYTPPPLELPKSPEIAREDVLGYNSDSDSVFEDLRLLVHKLTQQIEHTTSKSLDANPEWRKPTRKLIKNLIEELQQTERRIKDG
jgi:ParB/RepB/Spo0J family partition protein